ncbi:uracil-DNA glycosylase [Terrilactibacillus laevilacticus]|uniref:Uracil-DNA glycosylase n=2 Tax=Terrilactibacillus laevilacticus TaxID=1380157 RepID=A0ABW5PV55_9BACI
MEREMEITAFVEKLARIKTNELTFNQYAYDHTLGETTRNNLNLYLRVMKDLDCHTLLVGEAPGYRGCRWSGVPFTSEYILNQQHQLFGTQQNHTPLYAHTSLQKEASATIVWQAFQDFGVFPLMWNAYPFHPHKLGNYESNRKPTRKELMMGKEFLLDLLELFSIDQVVAIGNCAKESLDLLQIESTKIRHPSNGGKGEFREGIRHLCTGV